MSHDDERRSGTASRGDRRLAVGAVLPAGFGLVGAGMALYLHLVPADQQFAMLAGFIPAVLFAGFGQLMARRAVQGGSGDMRARASRRMASLLSWSAAPAVAGAVTPVLNRIVPPRGAPASFFTLAGVAVVFGVIGLLLPFAFLARRGLSARAD